MMARAKCWRAGVDTMDVESALRHWRKLLRRLAVRDLNTDRAVQFTRRGSPVCCATRRAVSMDGRGRWMDNVFIERLWRSLKYECVYCRFETGSECERAGRLDGYYNARRHTPPGRTNPGRGILGGATKLAA